MMNPMPRPLNAMLMHTLRSVGYSQVTNAMNSEPATDTRNPKAKMGLTPILSMSLPESGAPKPVNTPRMMRK